MHLNIYCLPLHHTATGNVPQLNLTEMNKQLKSRLMSIAHAIKGQFATFAEALRHAWRVVRLYRNLTKQTVSFRFRKVSGEIREAVGTLRADMLPESKGTGCAVNFGVLVYFDLSVEGGGAWRSAKVEKLIF